MIGRVVGNYKVLEKIGEGGMGAVYRGVDLMLERMVAIKVLLPELAREEHIAERFRSEAVTLARINHPRVATLYGLFRDGNDLFMAMEFVSGEPLDRVIKREGRMHPVRALTLCIEALEGIGHAHHLGIIHRDIKPANIMLNEAGAVKVMDFGIARVLGSARMTRTGRLIGTLEYMAPEQIRGDGGDERSDLYAIGILLYEMLTGRVPFNQDSDYDLMRAKIETDPPSPRTFVADLPEALEQVLLQALATKPEDRFQTASAFQEALEDTLAAMAAEAPPALDPANASPSALKATRVAAATRAAATPAPTRAAHGGLPDAMPATRVADAVPAPTRSGSGEHAPLLDQVRERMLQIRTPYWAGAVGILLALSLILVLSSGDAQEHGPAEPDDPHEQIAEEISSEEPAAPEHSSSSMAPFLPSEQSLPPQQPGFETSTVTEEVMPLLEKAHQYFNENKLTSPPQENALDYCHRVLMLDPGNQAARELIRQIAERYEHWGDAQMERGNAAKAVGYYEQSLAVVPGNARVSEKLERARQASSAATPAHTTPTPSQPKTEQRQGAGRTVALPAGTRIEVELEHALAAVNGVKEGDQVRFHVVENVVVGGKVVIRKGAAAFGTVTQVRRARSLLRGELYFTIRSVESVDGKQVMLRTGEYGAKADRGQDAFIQAGKRYQATVATDVSISLP